MSRIILAALLLASAQAPLGSTLVAVALPEIATGLRSDTVRTTTLLVASYLVITVLFQGPGGRLSDAIGHARTLWIGIGLFGLGSVAGLVSPSIWALALARSITAIGGALVVPSTMALLRILVQPERRGWVFGAFGATMALSAALGPVIGGVVVELLGWRAVFLVSLPFLILASFLLRIFPLPAPKEAGAGVLRSLDLFGLAMLFALYWLAIPTLAMAGSLGRKKRVPAGTGTLPTHNPLFIGWLAVVVILVGALSFLPALALGPIVEQLLLQQGSVF